MALLNAVDPARDERELGNRLKSAISSDQTDSVKELLALGPTTHTLNEALIIAACCEGQDSTKLELLLDAGAEIEHDQKPFIRALIFGNVSGANYLLDRGALINPAGYCKDYALLMSAKWADTSCLERLLEAGCDVNSKDDLGMTPLLYASERLNYNAAVILLDRGAGVNVANNRKWTPLMQAARGDDMRFLKLLLDSGADVEARNDNGDTPLMNAVVCGKVEAMDVLLDHGACLDVGDKRGKSLLARAAEVWRLNIVEKLVALGCDLEATDCHHKTPLFTAIERGATEVAEFFIEKGASVHVVADDGKNPLTITFETLTRYSKSELVLKLLDRRADLMLSEKDRKYFNKMVILGFNKVLQKLVANGWAPAAYPVEKGRQFKSLSLFATSLLSNNVGAARYLLANRFLTHSDVTELSTNPRVQDLFFEDNGGPEHNDDGGHGDNGGNINDINGIGDEEGDYDDDNYDEEDFDDQDDDDEDAEDKFNDMNNLILSLLDSPFSLFTLSFVAVSTALGASPPTVSDSPVNLSSDTEEGHTNNIKKNSNLLDSETPSENNNAINDNQSSQTSLTDSPCEREKGIQPTPHITNAREDHESHTSVIEITSSTVAQKNQSPSLPSTTAAADSNNGNQTSAISSSTQHQMCSLNADRECFAEEVLVCGRMTRREKIQILPLPESLKKALLFQTESAAIDTELWTDISVDRI